MITYGQIVDDIMVTLGFEHDDALRHRDSVLYNVKLALDKKKKEDIEKDLNVGGDPRAASNSISTFPGVPLTVHTASDLNDWDYHSFTLPTSIYDLPQGRGIAFIRYNRLGLPLNCPPAIARAVFTQATIAQMASFYGDPYQKPSPSQPYFARDKDRIYVYGVSPEVTHLIVGLFATPNFTTLDPDEEVDISPDLVYNVKRMVLAMESWALQIPQERLKNDGRDFEPNQIVRTSPIMSINDPSQFDK